MLAFRPAVSVADPAPTADEYQVKAAFLYNFTRFVQWPWPPAGPFVIAVVGDDRIAEALERVVRGKTAHGRAVVVRRLAPSDDPRGAHILFVTADSEARTADLRARALAAGVLTVGESPYFLREGGMIRFLVDDNRVRFQIDAAAAQAAGLRISSQLLSLAVR